MSYNGIGLNSAKGSGTNGFVQRNLSNLYGSKGNDETNGKKFLKREKWKQKEEKRTNRKEAQLDKDILEHESKRRIEVKSMEYRDYLEEDETLEDSEIDRLVADYQAELVADKLKADTVKERRERYRQPKEENRINRGPRSRSVSPSRPVATEGLTVKDSQRSSYNDKVDPFKVDKSKELNSGGVMKSRECIPALKKIGFDKSMY